MKLSLIKTISLTFIISTALSLPSFAKTNDDSQPSINEKFEIVQGYWKNKCINKPDNSIKTKHKSVQMYLHFKKNDKNNLQNIGKIKLFKKKNCTGKFTTYVGNEGNSVHSSQLSSMQVIDKNHVQDSDNRNIKFTRITKAQYDKIK
ncbi:MAG: hypothetical protein KGV51_08560 [Moraxellaceae bacterium]|nr:hypothetical protein [Moraxellaceae bacterium]